MHVITVMIPMRYPGEPASAFCWRFGRAGTSYDAPQKRIRSSLGLRSMVESERRRTLHGDAYATVRQRCQAQEGCMQCQWPTSQLDALIGQHLREVLRLMTSSDKEF